MSDAPGGAAIEGFLLGAGLIIAIGAQNAFVLRQGLQRRHVLAVATVCALSDAVLIAVGVGGLGSIVRNAPQLLRAITAIGIVFLVAYGAMAARRAARGELLAAAESGQTDLRTALAVCLALTFLNPHVYLDTVVLVGGISARHPWPANLAFGAGAAVASTVWFFGLAYGARVAAPLFAKQRAWRILDVLIALVMWGIAARLIGELW